jgi:hypothetical protein
MNKELASFCSAGLAAAAVFVSYSFGFSNYLVTAAIVFSLLLVISYIFLSVIESDHKKEILYREQKINDKIDEIKELKGTIHSLTIERDRLSNENIQLINEKMISGGDLLKSAGKAIAEELADGSLKKFQAETKNLLGLRAHAESILKLKTELKEKTDLAHVAIMRGQRALAKKDKEYGHQIFAAERTQLLFNHLKAVIIESGVHFNGKTPEETFEIFKQKASERVNNDPKMLEWKAYRKERDDKKKQRKEALRQKGIQARTDLRAANTEIKARVDKLFEKRNLEWSTQYDYRQKIIDILFDWYVTAKIVDVKDITDDQINLELFKLDHQQFPLPKR